MAVAGCGFLYVVLWHLPLFLPGNFPFASVTDFTPSSCRRPNLHSRLPSPRPAKLHSPCRASLTVFRRVLSRLCGEMGEAR